MEDLTQNIMLLIKLKILVTLVCVTRALPIMGIHALRLLKEKEKVLLQ